MSVNDWNHRDWAILAALTVLAAVLRFYKLGDVPPGFQFDEAYNAIDAALVLDGQRPLFLPANAGREVLYTYWQAALAAVLGLNLYTLRLASALPGVVAVPTAYLLLRRLLHRHSRAIAGWTALVLAISFWHLHFSHYGIRVILMPVMFSGVFGFFWVGAHGDRRWPYVLSGVLAGLSVWTHPTGRLVPFVLVGYVVWLVYRDVRHRRLRVDGPLGGLVLSGVAAFVVFVPLGIEFYRHPDFFFGHASDVSVFAERVSGGSPLYKIIENTVRVLGMVSLEGDRQWIHNLAGRPVFDPLLSVPFWLGVLVWARRLVRHDDPDRDALMLLGLWTVVMLFPSVLSDDAPNFSRTLPALPALFVAAGLGFTLLFDLRVRLSGIAVGPVLAVFILVIGTWVSGYDYFYRFPRTPEAYYAYDVDKLDAWEYLQSRAGGHQVYLSQLWAEHATIDLLRRQSGTVKSVDTDDTIVLPPAGTGALYAFPPEQEGRAKRLAAVWPDVEPQWVPDRYGRPLLRTVTVDAEMLQSWPALLEPTQTRTAGFEGGPTLLGMRSEGTAVRLFWRSEEKTPRNLTSFVHLFDDGGNRVGQIDKVPGNGSYPTPAWTPGERIIERYRPEVDHCAGGTEARVQVGWYELARDGERLPRVDAPGTTALGGELVLPIVSYPRDQMQPTNVISGSALDGLTVVGYDRDDSTVPGSPFTVDLFLSGTSAAGEEPMALVLDDGHPNSTLTVWHGTVVPSEHVRWQPDEVICRRVQARIPDDVPAGSYELYVEVGDSRVSLGAVSVEASDRRFTPPPMTYQVDAVLGEQVRLLGYDVERQDERNRVEVTLVWQALRPFDASYTVFVHLVDAAGAIVAQSDAVPADGYATTSWVPDEVVVDVHTLELPTEVADATYQLLVGMYDPVGGQRLPARTTAGDAIPDAAVPVGEIVLP